MTSVMNGVVGERVRQMRESMGLSLRELAGVSGVSAPMLSQVERGETSPTLVLAERIAQGLGLTLSQLLRLDEEPQIAVVRKRHQRSRKRGGHVLTELTPPLPGQRHAVTSHVLKPGAATGGMDDPPLHEPGSRETAVVVTGVLTLVVGDERYELNPGDAVTFDADLAHHFENDGADEVAFMATVTAGWTRGGGRG